ncbi:MAG TPA: hypothetical protein VK956_03210 [Verrucomicrobium sp.]|nr:hypothetical protein [Verrucomicrobium sp.]
MSDFMRDPAYAVPINLIERCILAADAGQGITLTDSLVRSAMVRATNIVKGKPSKQPWDMKNPKEALQAGLERRLLSLCLFPGQSAPTEGTKPSSVITRGIWQDAMKAVKDSSTIRATSEPGSRSYLDFLHRFMQHVDEKVAGSGE